MLNNKLYLYRITNSAICFFLAFYSPNASYSAYEAWDIVRFDGLPNKEYRISSGTGFYINDNYILTNKHVVQKCLKIAIRGAVSPSIANLYIADHELDLALIYTTNPPRKIPYLRINYDQISVGDILFTIGYPLDHSDTGQYVISEASVTTIKNHTEGTNFTNIQFTDVIDHGNSGGPLLDKNANIVGVVTAKLTTSSKIDNVTTVKNTGMAIGMDGIISFLRKHNIFFAANSTYDIFRNYKIDEVVRNYVVNIHCIQE